MQAPEIRLENQLVRLLLSVVLEMVGVFTGVFCDFALFGSGWSTVLQVVMSKKSSPSASGGVIGDGGLLALGFDFDLVSVGLAGGRLVIVK